MYQYFAASGTSRSGAASVSIVHAYPQERLHGLAAGQDGQRPDSLEAESRRCLGPGGAPAPAIGFREGRGAPRGGTRAS